jgi:hypothetical protein
VIRRHGRGSGKSLFGPIPAKFWVGLGRRKMACEDLVCFADIRDRR